MTNKKKQRPCRRNLSTSDGALGDNDAHVDEQDDEKWRSSLFEAILDNHLTESFISKSSLAESCCFGSEAFLEVMDNLIENPNITSSHLFRADVFYDSEKDSSFFPEAWSFPARSAQKTDQEVSSTRSDGLEAPEASFLRNESISDFIKHMRRELKPRRVSFKNYDLRRVVVRKLVPRNPDLDRPLIQTCCFFRSLKRDSSEPYCFDDQLESDTNISLLENDLIVYFPHAEGAEDIPWYHPPVKALAFLHECGRATSEGHLESDRGQMSIHILSFPQSSTEPCIITQNKRLGRILNNLLSKIVKHGRGSLAGYQKRGNHDQIIPRAQFQDTFTRLKRKYAKIILHEYWREVTDATKGVFEDLAIAAFLLELWGRMYSGNVSDEDVSSGNDDYDRNRPFPGFVDIGCGNGILTYILLSEGYTGMGFDARDRKTWRAFPETIQQHLKRQVLLPAMLDVSENHETNEMTSDPIDRAADKPQNSLPEAVNIQTPAADNFQDAEIHDGVFHPGTFIISNHADELTPWTPLLAYASNCPFISIPCCSHDLTGEKYRHPTRFLQYQDDLVNGRLGEDPVSCATGDQSNDIVTHELKRRVYPSISEESGGAQCQMEDEQSNFQVDKKYLKASGYSTLTAYIIYLTDIVGYKVEKEMLRIPSTRNACILARHRRLADGKTDLSYRQRIAQVRDLVERETGKSMVQVRELWRLRALKVVNEKRGSH